MTSELIQYNPSDLVDGMNHECPYCFDPLPRYDMRWYHWLWECQAYPNERRRVLMSQMVDNGAATNVSA